MHFSIPDTEEVKEGSNSYTVSVVKQRFQIKSLDGYLFTIYYLFYLYLVNLVT